MTDERWPTVPGGENAADTTSMNHLRMQEWLDEQEWPGPSNEWLSRKGHPLNPSHTQPQSADVHELARWHADFLEEDARRLQRLRPAHLAQPIPHPPGCRPGSAKWREHTRQLEQQAALERRAAASAALDERWLCSRQAQHTRPELNHLIITLTRGDRHHRLKPHTERNRKTRTRTRETAHKRNRTASTHMQRSDEEHATQSTKVAFT